MYSTAYMFLEIIMQLFLCNVAVLAVGVPLTYFGLGNPMYCMGFGMTPIMLTMIWSKVAENPEEPTRFCCFPCLIPMKFIPLCFLLLLLIGGIPKIAYIVYCALGYYQFMVRKKSLLRLPLKFYRKFDSCMPEGIKSNSSYVKVTSVESNLKKVCLAGGCCDFGGD